MDEVEKELYKKALKKWGNQAQIMMLFEEMSELQKAVCKLTRKDQGPISDVIEEIVDVQIMIDQLKIMVRASDDELFLIKVKKLARLNMLIKGEKS